jgi:hypothetical protein
MSVATATPKVDRKLAVAIAKDVLKHLKLFKPTQGTYVYFSGEEKEEMRGMQAQDHIDQLQKKCVVCALGACFLSYIRLENQVTVGDVYSGNYSVMMEKLKTAFEPSQLSLIESAFEHDYRESRPWWKGRPYPRTRLKAIMANIVKNKGTFKL